MTGTGPEPETEWSFVYCEQCGSGIPMSHPDADRVPRTCRDCGLLSCRACWPTVAPRCTACELRAVAASPPHGPAEDVVTPVPRRIGRRRARVVAGIGAFTALSLVLGSIAILAARPAGDVAQATGTPSAGVPGVAGGTSPSPSATPSPATPTASPSASPTPSASPSLSPVPTATATPSPTGPARLVIADQVMRTWVDPFGEVRAQVIVSVTNHGGAPGVVPLAETAYRVLAPDGDVVATGVFAHVFPSVVNPNQTTWLIDTISATFTSEAELARLEVDLETRAPRPDELTAPRLVVDGIQVARAEDGGLEVSGVVHNTGSAAVPRGAVGIVVRGADGSVLGGVYDVTSVLNLQPGASVEFRTAYPTTAPIDPAEVTEALAAAVLTPD